MAVAGDVGRDGLGLDDDGRRVLASCDVVVHSAATVAFDAPLDTAVEVNLLGPSRVAAAIETRRRRPRRDASRRLAHPPRHGVDRLCGRHPSRRRHRDARHRGAGVGGAGPHPHHRHHRGGHRGRGRRRRGACATTSSPSRARPSAWPSFTKAARAELGAAGTHLLAERAEKLRDEWVRDAAGRARAGPAPRPSAGPTPTPSPRRSGERALVGLAPGRPHHHRAALDHRVGAGRAAPGLDPGLPHGRAHHHLLRPGLAARVPRGARRRGRRHPRRHGGGRHHRRGRRRARPRRAHRLPGRLGRAEPAPLRRARRPGAGVVHRAPALRLRRPAHRRARVVVPRSRQGPAPAAAGHRGARARPSGCSASLPVRGRAGRPRGARSRSDAPRPSGPSATSSSTAPTPRPRRTFASTASRAVRSGSTPPDRDALLLRPRRDRLGPTTSTTSTCRRSSSTPGCGPRRGDRRWPAARTGPARAILSPERHLAAFDLENTLVASNVVESYAWLASRHLPVGERVAFTARILREAPAPARPRPARPRRLPAHLLPPLRGRARRSAARRRRWRCSTTCCWPSPSRPASPACAPTGPSATAPCSSPAPSTSWSSRCARCSTRSCAPASGSDDDGRLTGRLDQLPPTGEARALVLAEYAGGRGTRPRRDRRLRRLGLGPAAARVRGVPGGREPRGTPGRHRPAPGLARRAVGQGRAAGPARARPSVPSTTTVSRWWARLEGMLERGAGSAARGAARCGAAAMKGLVFERNLARFAAARVASASGARVAGPAVGPLRLTDVEPPELPGPAWHRVRALLAGICGSDLSTVDGRSSRYFEDVVSFPFVPGHEVVGTRRRHRRPRGGRARARLRRRAASIPPCPACAEGRTGGVSASPSATWRPGLQIGFCADTGGGWSTGGLVAHDAQLHAVPDELSDDDAVMVEPTACAVHAALGAGVDAGRHGGRARGGHPRAVHRGRPAPSVPPRHAARGADATRTNAGLAEELGADAAVEPDQLVRAVRRSSRSLEASGTLTGGADVVIDCVGQRRVDRRRPWPWCGPGAGSCSWACRAGSPSTWRRCGTARSRSPAPTPTGPRTSADRLRRTFDVAIEVVRGQGPRPPGLGPLPARSLRGGPAPTPARPGAGAR